MTFYGQIKSFSPENQLCITCPVFKVNTRIIACFMLRDQIWRGDRVEVRQGCQVALHANKCPISHIVKEIAATGKDDYYSATPQTRAIAPNILERISKILVDSSLLDRATINQRERELLIEGNERAVAESKGTTRARKSKTKTTVAPANDKLTTAAASGDLTSALNAAPKR